jgi:hypothetical protein
MAWASWSIHPTKHYSGGQIKNEMGRACGTYGRTGAQRISVGNSWDHFEDVNVNGRKILKRIFKKLDGRHGLDLSGSAKGQVPRSCKCGNKLPGSMKVWNLISLVTVDFSRSLLHVNSSVPRQLKPVLKTHFSRAPFNIIKSYAISLRWSYCFKFSNVNLFLLAILHPTLSLLNQSMTVPMKHRKSNSSSLKHFFFCFFNS